MRDPQNSLNRIAQMFGLLLVALAYLGDATGWAKTEDAYVGSAQSYIEKGNLKAAEIELRNAVRQSPQDAHLHALLAQVYLKLGEFASAEREARSARDLNGSEQEYLLTLAEAMGRLARFFERE